MSCQPLQEQKQEQLLYLAVERCRCLTASWTDQGHHSDLKGVYFNRQSHRLDLLRPRRRRPQDQHLHWSACYSLPVNRPVLSVSPPNAVALLPPWSAVISESKEPITCLSVPDRKQSPCHSAPSWTPEPPRLESLTLCHKSPLESKSAQAVLQ